MGASPSRVLIDIGDMAQRFLATIGVLYIGLGIWCTLAPVETSQAVGFLLQAGKGQSEFLTVYGGLEVGLGLLFVRPLFRRDEVAFTLWTCMVLHACIVAFRAAGFFLYSGLAATTYVLAAIEWAIFLGALWLWRRSVATRSQR